MPLAELTSRRDVGGLTMPKRLPTCVATSKVSRYHFFVKDQIEGRVATQSRDVGGLTMPLRP